MTIDQTYFFWGCGEPIQYGLYSPVADRLVCVRKDYELFEYIVFLMSSKIRLLIVPLHLSPNFNPDLIDNTCCTQWSIVNWPPQALSRRFAFPETRENFIVDTCGDLIEKPNKDLTDIQNFIFLSCQAVQLFKFSKNYQYRIFSNLVKLPFNDFDRVKDLEIECFRNIYIDNDYNSVKEKVKQIFLTVEELL
jgi:hypothetical protein